MAKTCFISLRNRKTGKRRVCGQPAGPNGVCAKHAEVWASVEQMNRDAIDSLSEPTTQEDE